MFNVSPDSLMGDIMREQRRPSMHFPTVFIDTSGDIFGKATVKQEADTRGRSVRKYTRPSGVMSKMLQTCFFFFLRRKKNRLLASPSCCE